MSTIISPPCTENRHSVCLADIWLNGVRVYCGCKCHANKPEPQQVETPRTIECPFEAGTIHQCHRCGGTVVNCRLCHKDRHRGMCDPSAWKLATDIARGVFNSDSEFAKQELEAWFLMRAQRALREVSIYETDEQESNAITVYMRCLEAVGVDVDAEAEHVRQVMRDALNKSKNKSAT